MGSRFNLEKTKSWWFLTPIFELDQYNLNYKYLLNVYLGSETHEELTDVIILHYDIGQPAGNLARIERNFSMLDSFICTYEPDEYSILFIFKVPNKWYNDYLLFVNGEYSRLSESYKTILINFYKISGQYKNAKEIEKILQKSPERRAYWEEKLDVKLPKDAEVASKINWTDEIYTKEKYGINNPLDKADFFFE